MSTSFTDWEQDYLEHHGIRGMHWGVRRYQNEDGSLTPAGEQRYGVNATKRTSAKRMTKDFNRLDKGYANVAADHDMYAKQTAYYSRKANKAKRKGKQEKAQKLLTKALENGKKASLTLQQKKAIEQLQWKIVGKAAVNGYTTTSEPVIRTGVNSYGRRMSKVGMLLGPMTSNNFKTANAKDVNGQQINISRRGNGGTKVVNYANANKLAAEEERRRRAQAMAGVSR